MKTFFCHTTFLLCIAANFNCSKLQGQLPFNLHTFSVQEEHDALELQSYPSDELIVLYDEGVTEQEKQEVRDLYLVADYETIGERIEFWMNLQFPIPLVDEFGEQYYIETVEELIVDIDTQTSANQIAGGNGNERAHLNSGDFNYTIEVPNTMTFSSNTSPSLLINCPEEEYRYRMNSYNGPLSMVTVIVLDEYVRPNLFENVEIIDFASVSTGFSLQSEISVDETSHAEKIISVINNLTTTEGIPVNIIAIPVFSTEGSDYKNLLKAFFLIKDLGVRDGIINLSARAISQNQDFSNSVWEIVGKILEENNLLLISSAGNDGILDGAIFPGTADIQNEITVVGAEDCFSEPWEYSNGHSSRFELAAEAKDIFVLNSIESNSYIHGGGTSFSSAIVTAAVAQLASIYESFDAELLKNTILANADNQPNFNDYVELGRVLNLEAASLAISFLNYTLEDEGLNDGISYGIEHGRENVVKVWPNPVVDELTLDIGEVIDISKHSNEQVTLRIIDINNESIYQVSQFSSLNREGKIVAHINPFLPSGLYAIDLTLGGDRYLVRFIKF